MEGSFLDKSQRVLPCCLQQIRSFALNKLCSMPRPYVADLVEINRILRAFGVATLCHCSVDTELRDGDDGFLHIGTMSERVKCILCTG